MNTSLLLPRVALFFEIFKTGFPVVVSFPEMHTVMESTDSASILENEKTGESNVNGAIKKSFDGIYNDIRQPDPYEILIVEIMADPTPPVSLPEKEYIEIKNISNATLILKDCILSDGVSESPFPEELIYPGEYLILCSVKDTLDFGSYGRVIGFEKFPSLNNTGDRLSLYRKSMGVLHEVSYEDAWHTDVDKREGGYSLEMVYIRQPCKGNENWASCRHFTGGTPGQANSLEHLEEDSAGPELLGLTVLSATEIQLDFNEQLYPVQSELLANWSISPTIGISAYEILYPFQDKLILNLADELQPGIRYRLTGVHLEDCLGNTSDIASDEIQLADVADYRDLVWSEVLFNPRTNGSDFVEVYNRSHKAIRIDKLWMRNFSKGETWQAVNTVRMLLPGQYLAFTREPPDVIRDYPGSSLKSVIEMEIPSIDDEGGHLQLAFQDFNKLIILDTFSFTRDWHHPFLNDVEGISLEKIDLEKLSQKRDNWQSAARSSNYGTPGYKNSQFQDTIHRSGDLPYHLSSRYISPDGDNYRDQLTIFFHLDQDGYYAALDVFSLYGNKVNTISYQVLASNDFIIWNGEDDIGEPLIPGNYILLIRIIHPAGKKSEFKERLVIDY